VIALFHTAFDKYERLVSRALIKSDDDANQLVSVDKEVLPTIPYIMNLANLDPPYEFRPNEKFFLVGSEESNDQIRDIIEKNRIEVAPAAEYLDLVRGAQNGGHALPAGLDTINYDYYSVQLGLNIILQQDFKLTHLRFSAELYGDDKISTDVIASDTFPDDQVRTINIISGEISLGVTELFKFIGGPVGSTLSNLLNIKLNPWVFKWDYRVIEIQSSKALTFHPEWLLKHDNIWKGFNPTLIIRKRKGIRNVKAQVTIAYRLELPKDHALQLRHPVSYQTDSKPVTIL
jgi:hypothetical protein